MTRVAFLWHMHQPFYQDLLTGEHVLPWVRLHALKDYWGMVALLREFPRIKATFNLVPSLLVQLEAYAREDARDRHLELGLKPAASLSEEERAFCVEQFFHAHRPRMIEPYPRYRELLELRGSNGGGFSARSQAAQFSVDDLRDLQVWHKLVWLDPDYHDHDQRVRALVAKGRGFTEDDKAHLRIIELELLRKVIPEYRAAVERGQVEVSTSPFYHPILPLLCDSDVYLETHPHSRMPREPFRHPEDAAEQLQRAASLHQQLFGQRPRGLWPSEGSVSDDMVPLVAQAGFRWMATDEEILARTLGVGLTRAADGHLNEPEVLYRPYMVGRDGAQVACGFRDHALSDLIGFSYGSWSPDGAADNFLHRIVAAGQRFAARTSGGEATIFIILDGENAWEYYDGQGRPFLRALYDRLQSHPDVKTVTMSEACSGSSETLPSIFPGSWINSDFYIWIGHPDDHRAWGQLVDARRALDAASGVEPAALARAREEMLIAEGSDWFWWYGDDHSSEHDLAFDELFRRHVRNVYRALDAPAPEELSVTNISTAPPAVRVDPPTGFIEPTVDGEATSYFEWVGAGRVDASETSGTMHQVAGDDPIVSAVHFGFNAQHLHIRIDGTRSMRSHLEGGLELRINFLKPAGIQVGLRFDRGALGVRLESRSNGGVWTMRECPDFRASAGQIVEVQVPFACLGVKTSDTLAFLIAVGRGGMELEHHPRHAPIETAVPGPEFKARNWTA